MSWQSLVSVARDLVWVFGAVVFPVIGIIAVLALLSGSTRWFLVIILAIYLAASFIVGMDDRYRRHGRD